MTEARHTILQMKYARIIKCIAEMKDVTLEQAMEMFYGSQTMTLIRDDVSDLHCRSDKYLAEEVISEY